GPTSHAAAARQKLTGMLDSPPEPLAEATRVFELILDMHRQNQLVVMDIYERGAKLAQQHEESDPKGALALLDVVAPLAPRFEDQLAARRRILERAVAREPDDP